MMAWRISEKSREMISQKISAPRPSTKANTFDDYYLMLILGLAHGTQKSNPLDDEEVFLQKLSPPADYEPQWQQIQALVIDAYLTEEGTDRSKKENVNAVIQQLISDEQETPLRDKFWEVINGYTRRGAECLSELPPGKKSWEDFMEAYYSLVRATYLDTKNKNEDEMKKYYQEWFEDQDAD
jgi:hypothetical protein